MWLNNKVFPIVLNIYNMCNFLLGIHYQELPQRRHSDGVDPTMRSGEGAVGGRPFPAIPNLTLRNGAQLFAARPRPQSESDVQLERRLGQELRRISDEFHMSYQQVSPWNEVVEDP